MSETLTIALNILDLSAVELALTCAVVFLAGCVRGFAGFGLSAVVMAGLVLILPPVELIPVLYLLEAAASLAMFRGGVHDADMGQVWPLAIGSLIGLPIGLSATTSIAPDVSKLTAVLVILLLTVLQFSRRLPTALATVPGRYAVGISAGIVTGLASVGGMVVALYVLASAAKPKEMRAALTMFLFIGMFTSLTYFVIYGVMTQMALLRGLIFMPIALAGVCLGAFAFKPALEVFYRRFCLCLLIAICVSSLVRLEL